MLLSLGSVFALAFFSFWTSIPAGIALGAPPVLVGLTAWLSYSSGVLLVALLGEPVRERLLRRFGRKATPNPNGLLGRAWKRFGVLGLALLAPVTTGAQIGAIVGIALGIPARRLLIAMALGAAIWSTGLTLAVALGAAAIRHG